MSLLIDSMSKIMQLLHKFPQKNEVVKKYAILFSYFIHEN